jgi:hypothetical protein
MLIQNAPPAHRLLALVLTATLAQGQALPEPDAYLAKLNVAYENSWVKIKEADQSARKIQLKKYAHNLLDLERKLKDAGQLEPLLAVRREIARLKQDGSLQGADAGGSTELQGLLTPYAKLLDDIGLATDKRRYSLSRKLDKSLGNLQASYTKENRIEDAVKIKEARDAFKQRPDVLAAIQAATETRPEPAPVPGPARPLRPAPRPPQSAARHGNAPAGVLIINLDRDFDYVPNGPLFGLPNGQTVAPALKEKPYERLTKEPAYKSRKVQYGFLKLGNAEDNRFSYVVDDLESDTWIVHFDRNNNNDLTDDGAPLKNQGSSKFATKLELEVPVVLPSGDAFSRPCHLWFFINDGGPRFYSRCHYGGDIRINGKKYPALVYEKVDHDILYQDSGIWIDLDRDGEMDKEKEHFENGSVLEVEGNDPVLRLDYP